MITILLATYNGAKYVAEQLDSLLNQTVLADRIVISDDGSTDGTLEILESYQSAYPSCIELHSNEGKHGAWQNFMGLMCRERDDYLMLCDQDDVWLPNKIELSLQAMQKAETEYPDTPLLVHTDLIVVDSELKVIEASYRRRMHADYERTELRHQIIQNTLTGCTAMYNRALAELLIEPPEYCVMHDWWLMLVAAAMGRIIPIYESTVLYRQHAGNQIGAKNMRSPIYLLKRAFSGRQVKQAIAETYTQAKSFWDIYKDKLTAKQETFLKDYVAIPAYGKIKRLQELRRLGVRKNSLIRWIGQMIYS